MAVKTDMNKAYDRLEWDFIAMVMERLGFHPQWIQLIMQCISTDHWNGARSLKCLPPSGISSVNLAAWVLWNLWTCRNKLVFNAVATDPMDVMSYAVSAAREWQNGKMPKQQKQRNTLPRPPPAVSSIPVVRSDAAWRENTIFAGLGWVVTCDKKLMKFSGVEPFVSSPLIAEGTALREALRKCKEMNLRRIRCEADSQQLIKFINKGQPLPELYGIVLDILALAAEFDFTSFVWIP